MGPKRQNEKDSCNGEESVDVDDEIIQLREKLRLAEAENAQLERTLRTGEEAAVHQRDELVRQYQQRINSINTDKEKQIHDLQQENILLREQSHYGSQRRESSGTDRRNYEVPMPRQLLFDGKSSWESFIHPFSEMVNVCNWDEHERLFRLKNSLRGEAAEYTFRQLASETLNNYDMLKSALELRFKEIRSVSSYVAELEVRRYNKDKEKLAEYVSDIKRLVLKGFPTADYETRETIHIRHFLKGLFDTQAAVFIGMKEPKTIDQARDLLETYQSLREEVKGARVRSVESKPQQGDYVTEARLQDFGRDLKTNLGKKIDNLANKLNSKNGCQRQRNSTRDRKDIECFKCHHRGHYASECTADVFNNRSEN